MTHSPLPWRVGTCGCEIVDAHGLIVCECESESDVPGIVRAINSHEALKEACEAFVAARTSVELTAALTKTIAALALAKGGAT